MITGPLSRKAGHDINYLAISGVLSVSNNKGEANSISEVSLCIDVRSRR